MKKINVLISTFFGYGYLTKMPGTVASLVTTIFIYIAYEYLGYTDLKFSIIFFFIIFFYSFYAVKDSESEFVNKDPKVPGINLIFPNPNIVTKRELNVLIIFYYRYYYLTSDCFFLSY